MPERTPIEVIAESTDFRVYALPPDQWAERQADLGYPQLPNPEFAFLIVVEEKASGALVASWVALTATMLEGLHIASGYRSQPEIHGLLLGGMFGMLASLHIAHPLTIADNPAILTLARKAGFKEVAGTLLMLE